MQRFSLSRIPPPWRKVALLLLALSLGVVADRLAILASASIYRTEHVTTIQGTRGQGCLGYSHYYHSFLGRPVGVSDGLFQSACGGRTDLTDTETLFCACY